MLEEKTFDKGLALLRAAILHNQFEIGESMDLTLQVIKKEVSRQTWMLCRKVLFRSLTQPWRFSDR